MSKKRIQTLNEARWRYWQEHFKRIDDLEKSLQRLMPFQDPKVSALHTLYVHSRVQLRTIIHEAREKVDDDNAAKARERAAKRNKQVLKDPG